MRFSVRLRLSLSILAVLVAGAALYGMHADYRRFLDTPLGVPTGGLVLEVKPGMGIGAIAQGAVSVAIILFMMGVLPVDGSSVFIERVGEVAATIIYVLLGRIVIEPPVRAKAA